MSQQQSYQYTLSSFTRPTQSQGIRSTMGKPVKRLLKSLPTSIKSSKR